MGGTFAILFGILAAHTLLETARDALFLATLPATHLPWVYLAIAVLTLGAGEVGARWHARHGLSLWLWFSAVVTAGLWVLAGGAAPPATWVLYAVYIWSGVCISMAVVQYWLLLGSIFTIDRAKRLYGLIGAGSVLGATVGGALAAGLSSILPARALLLAAAGLLTVTGFGPLWLASRVRREAARPLPLKGALRAVVEHPYVGRLAALVIASTLTFTVADYVFKSLVAQHVEASSLATFFAVFYTALNGVALVVQLVAVGWLLRVVGVQRVLLVTPTLVAAAGLAVAATGGLVAALALKAVDGTLKHSLHRTAAEVLFLPISDRLRPYAKRFVDMVGQRAAQAAASLLILGTVAAGGDERVLALLGAGLALLWLGFARSLRPHYLNLFRDQLRQGSIAAGLTLPHMDLNAFESLMGALNSPEDSEVLTAIHVLARAGKGHLIPALILHHPSKSVRIQSLELFAGLGRRDHLALARQMLRDEDPEVRAAVLRAHPSPEILAQAEHDPSPLVRATALVARVAGDGEAGDATGEAAPLRADALAALNILQDFLTQGGPRDRLGLAHAIAGRPHPAFTPLLLELAHAPEPAVQLAVAHAMAANPSPQFIPALIQLLAHREVRTYAREALVRTGDEALEALGRALADRSLAFVVRRHVPRAISSFRNARAASILLDRMLHEPNGMLRYRCLRGIERIRAYDRAVPLDRAVLREATQRTLVAAYTLLDWRLILDREARANPARKTTGHVLLRTLLADKERNTVERLLRILGLWLPGEDFDKIYRGLRSSDPVTAASSLELLENLLQPPLREAIVGLAQGLVGAAPEAERLRAGARFYKPVGLGYEALLAHILTFPSDSLRAITAYHIGELGLVEIRGVLEAIPTEPDSYAGEVIDRALERLVKIARGEATPVGAAPPPPPTDPAEAPGG